MIRGINKHIIEVLDTHDEYIEKAILFVNPKKAHESSKKILTRADLYFKSMIRKPMSKKDRFKATMISFAKILSIFILGVAVAAFIMR